jgi:hypothetical protein
MRQCVSQYSFAVPRIFRKFTHSNPIALDKTFLFLALLLIPFTALISQETASLPYAELGLKKQLASLKSATDEQERLAVSDRFAADLGVVLAKTGSFNYPFDSLKGITSVTSPDGRFRLFTWPVPLDNGRYRYYGILLTAVKKTEAPRVISLSDRCDSIADPGKALLSPSSWFGAVYYQVIPVKLPGGDVCYTLLGWRGIDVLVSSRLIEVLTFASDGSVTFGRRLFCTKERQQETRLIFRYSAKASMVLSYEKQSVVTGKKWNASSRTFETERIREMLIVLDRLVPMDPQMEGRYEYYIPSSDVMDGFTYKGGCWTMVTEIDARNPYQKPKPPPKSPGK